MRFKEFITEDTALSVQSYKKNLDIMLNRGLVLYRGIRIHDVPAAITVNIDISGRSCELDARIFKQRTDDRHSKTGSNVLLDLSTNWEGIPSRKKSCFVTQSLGSTGTFGKPFIIVPADDVDMFAYSTEDFNQLDDLKRQVKRILQLIEKFLYEFRTCLTSDYDDVRSPLVKIADSVKVRSILINSDWKNVASSLTVSQISALVNQCRKQMNSLHINISRIEPSFMTQLTNLDNELLESPFNSYAALIAGSTPEVFGINVFDNLRNLPMADCKDEIWFEGGYLAIEPTAGKKNEHLKILAELRKKYS